MIELPGECGTCYSGRSIDYLVVSKNLRHCIRNVWAVKSAPWSTHVAIAFDVLWKPSKIRTWQLVSPSPLIPQAPSHSRDEWLKRFRLAENAVPSNSPQEAAVSRLRGPAPDDSSSYPSCFPSGRWLLSGASRPNVNRLDLRGAGGWSRREASSQYSARSPYPSRESTGLPPKGRTTCAWACVWARLSEVKRCLERGKCNCGQFRESVEFLQKCVGEVPTRTPPEFCTTISGLAGSAKLNLSVSKLSRAWCLRQGHE